MSGNLSKGTDKRLDEKLDHVLQEFLFTKGERHEIRLMFTACDLYQFEDFVDYELEHIQKMRRKSNGGTKSFDDRKVTQIYNVIRYAAYLRRDQSSEVLAEDPENWVPKDFRLWKDA